MLFSYLQDELKKKKAAEKLKRKNYEIESLKKVILQFVCWFSILIVIVLILNVIVLNVNYTMQH